MTPYKIFESLVRNNVKHAFIYSGGSIMPLIDQFHKNDKIDYFICTDERGASLASSGYAKYSGNTGVSIVTSGPGVTNSITGLLDANADSSPMLLLSGQVSENLIGTNAFQECPATEISKSITKWSYRMKSGDSAKDVLDEAFRVANHGKKGSVHIDIPKNIMTRDTTCEFQQSYPGYQSHELHSYVSEDLRNIISNARKPIIICGKGAQEDFSVIREFVKKHHIPATSTLHGMGIVDETCTDSLCLPFMGMHGHVSSNFAVQNADLVIGLGCRFDDRITGEFSSFAPEANKNHRKSKGGIVNVNIHTDDFGKTIRSHFNVNMKCETFVKQVIHETPSQHTITQRKKWCNTLAKKKNSSPSTGQADTP